MRIDLQEFVVGYSKAPEQPQCSARPICHSHAMRRTGREPATIHIAACGSSPWYALCQVFFFFFFFFSTHSYIPSGSGLGTRRLTLKYHFLKSFLVTVYVLSDFFCRYTAGNTDLGKNRKIIKNK